MHVTQAALLVPEEGLNHCTFVHPSFTLTVAGAHWQIRAEDSHQTLASFTFKFYLKHQHFRQVRSVSSNFILLVVVRNVAT